MSDITPIRPDHLDYRGTDDRFRIRLSPGVILVYLLVLGVLLAVGWYGGTRAADERTEALRHEPEVTGQTTDDFDRTDGPQPLGPSATDTPTGISWALLGAGFETTSDGTAQVMGAPVGENSMALTDPGQSSVTVLTTVESAPQGSGLVFRFQDLFNHWTLTSAPDFGTWNLTLTVDGQTTYSQSIGLSSNAAGTTLAVRLEGPSITVFVDGAPAFALVDPTFEQATTVGLVGVNGSKAAFGEFTVVLDDLVLGE